MSESLRKLCEQYPSAIPPEVMQSDDAMLQATERLQLADLAKKAGVPVTTVSRVLQGKAGIPDPVRRRVLRLARCEGALEST